MNYRERHNEVIKEMLAVKAQMQHALMMHSIDLDDYWWEEHGRLCKKWNALFDEYELTLPCKPLQDLIGWELHDLYKEKYPISKRTEVRRVSPQRFSMGRSHHYSIHRPIDILNMDFDSPVPTVEPEYRIAYFEDWAIPDLVWAELSYSGDLDVVFVGDIKYK